MPSCSPRDPIAYEKRDSVVSKALEVRGQAQAQHPSPGRLAAQQEQSVFAQQSAARGMRPAG